MKLWKKQPEQKVEPVKHGGTVHIYQHLLERIERLEQLHAAELSGYTPVAMDLREHLTALREE